MRVERGREFVDRAIERTRNRGGLAFKCLAEAGALAINHRADGFQTVHNRVFEVTHLAVEGACDFQSAFAKDFVDFGGTNGERLRNAFGTVGHNAAQFIGARFDRGTNHRIAHRQGPLDLAGAVGHRLDKGRGAGFEALINAGEHGVDAFGDCNALGARVFLNGCKLVLNDTSRIACLFRQTIGKRFAFG